MIYKSIFASPLGYLEVCADGGDAVTRIFFTSSPSESFTENDITKKAATQLEEYFKGARRVFDIPLLPEGTAFEQEVWQACREIPYGETRTNKQLAAQIGDEKATRKVTRALEANPIAILIPAHRVKGKTNFLSGFAADTAVKEALLGAEKSFLKKQ